jgi:hypothetical protein
LASCLRRLIEDDGLRETLSRQGRKIVAREFDVDGSAKRLLGLFAGR